MRRIPFSFHLSWNLPSKVPREAVRVDYELWRSGDPRFKDSTSAIWDKQYKELLDCGLMRNKTQGGKSNVSITIAGDTAQVQVQEQHAKSGSSSTTTRKDIVVKIGSWRETSVMAYEFPPLKDMWAMMVKMGWVRPDDIMPITEQSNVMEMEMDAL